MEFFALASAAAGGVLALLCNRRDKLASGVGSISCAAALVWVLFCALKNVASGDMNAMAALFQLPIALVGLAAALHAPGYLAGHAEGRTGIFWFFFNLIIASMLAVTLAKGFPAFLLAWELMGLFSFALVAFEWRSKNVLRAAWVYLIVCEAGGLLLILLATLSASGAAQTLLFGIAGLIAFGLKAGFPMLHIWLPDAHPAAPAPVSAVMSAAMIPLGFYGILRFLNVMLNPGFFGWIFLVLGLTGAFLGILFGMAQKDLKRLLAYSSIENMGIVSLGFGLGLLGVHYSCFIMCFCGLSGAFLHILNHAMLKGTLFLGAGSVLKSVHTLNMDLMGGLMRKNPLTCGFFTAASVGISGLPPFCGFFSELLIYIAAFTGIAETSGALFAASFASAAVLAVTGGVACMAFAKAVSSVFLGACRTDAARECAPERKAMAYAMGLLFLPSLAVPLCSSWIVEKWLAPLLPLESAAAAAIVAPILQKAGIVCALVMTLFGILYFLKRLLPRGKENAVKGVWDCGYAEPTARMQYTGSAFAQPLADLFDGILRQKKAVRRVERLFPETAAIDVETDDFGERLLWRPVFRLVGVFAEKIHKFQSGYLHIYILVMVAALLGMLLWGFAFAHPGENPAGARGTEEVSGK